MDTKTLEATAKALVPPGKGILAADESMGTIGKRFGALGIECTEENRRVYRQMLFTSPGLAECISGVILFDETIRQKTDDGTPFPQYLESQGAIPGIKVDKGKIPLPAAPGEDVTEGLDGLRDRLAEYRDLGARFAKWRSVIHIGPGLPTTYAIDANAHGLARYAALCQDAGLVPIVEPEVLMDGDHDIERCLQVTERTLRATYRQMAMQRLHLEGTLLKPNMVLSGKGCPTQASPKEVAEATLTCLRRAVPASVPGIVFLSGGQTDDQATENLDAINRAEGPKPWQLSFSYGRALQAAAMTAWGGKPTNIEEGKAVFQKRALANAAARDGRYSPAA
jgi:fructose-bisphosphate aldolase class I